MAVTAADLLAYVNPDQYAGGSADPNDKFVASCVARAIAIVGKYIGDREVPEPIVDGAVLEVGSELYNRRKAPNGVAQFGQGDGTPTVFTARDPLIRAYPILDQWVPNGVA